MTKSSAKSHVWVLICEDAAGWRDDDSLWSPDYDDAASRVFGSRAEALGAKRALDSYDYSEGLDGDDHQPTFRVGKIATVTYLGWAALVACDDNLTDAIADAADLPPVPAAIAECPDGTPCAPSDLSRDDLLTYISGLPRRLRAAAMVDPSDYGASQHHHHSAALRGASSAWLAHDILGAYADAQLAMVLAACAGEK